MKPIIFAVVAFAICSVQAATQKDGPTKESLVGGYIGGEAKLYLTLCDNGTYSAGKGTCTGLDGIADGTWKVIGNQITFSPTNETKLIRGLLRKADIVKDGKYWAFVRPEDREAVKRNGITWDTCLKNTEVLRK